MGMTWFTDAELVAAVRAGDADAFAPIVARYRDGLARLASRLLGNADDAEDVLQSAFIRAFRNIAACREPDRLRSWLMQIVVNECRTFGSRRARRETRFVRDLDAVDAVRSTEIGDPAFVREAVFEALAQLPDDQREAFVLKHVDDLDYETIAEVTGDSVSALKMRVKRACARLRTLLEEYGHVGTAA